MNLKTTNKKTRNLIEYFCILILPLSIFLVITIRNKKKLDDAKIISESSVTSNENSIPSQEEQLIKDGIRLINQKQYEQSIEINLKALAINPNNKTTHNNLGFAYGNLKNWDKGISHCQKAIALDPNFQLAKNNLNWMMAEKTKTQQ